MIITDESQAAAVRLDRLVADPDNPRTELTDIKELAMSISEQGLLQPLLVRQTSHADGTPGELASYTVIDGHRRFAALQLLDFDDEIPVRVVDLDRTGRLLAALTTQLHGQPLPPLDEARAFQHLVDLGLTQRQIAERVGCNQSHVSKRLSLVELPDTAAKALSEGKINVREAERFARTGSVEPPKKVEKVATFVDTTSLAHAKSQGPSPDAIENLGNEVRQLKKLVKTHERTIEVNEETIESECELRQLLQHRLTNAEAARDQLNAENDALLAHITELEEELATFRERQMLDDYGVLHDPANYLFPPADEVIAALEDNGVFAKVEQLQDEDAAGIERRGVDVEQASWELEHTDCTTRLPWPPYRSTAPDRIVVFLRTTLRTEDAIRHVIAYESTHEQRPEILQAAADRLFELS